MVEMKTEAPTHGSPPRPGPTQALDQMTCVPWEQKERR